MKKIIILYVPVLHQGYLRFFKKHRDAEILFLPGKKLVSEFTTAAEEIRQIDAEKMRVIIESSGLHKHVWILERKEIPELKKNISRIITANDSVSLGITEKYFPEAPKTIDTIFLRWDEKNVYSQKDVKYDRVSTDDFDRKMIAETKEESKKSSDWWRRVGAVLLKKAKQKKLIIAGYNSHVPSEHTPYSLGDPRDFIKAGEKSEISSTVHAEEMVFIKAVRNGISVAGTDLYATVFPCPRCAKLIAYSGIKRLFFASGHASLDGFEILKSQNVEVVFVQ